LSHEGVEPLCAAPAAGEVAAAELDGERVVVWTGADGEPCVMAGRCPHQWSPLDVDGSVMGDELVCITHGWRFDRSGRGTKRSVLGRRDRKGDIDVYPHRVRDGMVYPTS
jgi:phenylpropionate dioxygenase-like ring-hydroxylating dioxygenase large terminal subunit